MNLSIQQKSKKRLCHATYWEYTGNHYNGHCNDCERQNPYGFPLALVSWMHHQGQAYTKISEQDGFGRIVDVAATKEDWEQEWIKCARYYGEKRVDPFTYGEVTVEEDGVCVWIYRECCDGVLEGFFLTPDETHLDMVKNGYAPTGLVASDGEEIWVECEKIASTK